MQTYTAVVHEAAAGRSVFGVLAVLVGGLVITGALIWAVRLGIKVRGRESRPPRPGEQPTRPQSGSTHESWERREADEVPRAADRSERLTPHELRPSGTKRSEDQTRPRWDSR
ncbi:DUF6479 family protein [Streptomyces sp. NPDC002588]|uniref:DUF6479 family protein n=1 Tax=Streptomyces sp. NPDC002588 TaxID=3154419 RepID=UPI00331F0E7B